MKYIKKIRDTECNLYINWLIFIKIFFLNFILKANKNCETCYSESKDVTNQIHIKCKDDYYKINEKNYWFYSMSSD